MSSQQVSERDPKPIRQSAKGKHFLTCSWQGQPGNLQGTGEKTPQSPLSLPGTELVAQTSEPRWPISSGWKPSNNPHARLEVVACHMLICSHPLPVAEEKSFTASRTSDLLGGSWLSHSNSNHLPFVVTACRRKEKNSLKRNNFSFLLLMNRNTVADSVEPTRLLFLLVKCLSFSSAVKSEKAVHPKSKQNGTDGTIGWPLRRGIWLNPSDQFRGNKKKSGSFFHFVCLCVASLALGIWMSESVARLISPTKKLRKENS